MFNPQQPEQSSDAVGSGDHAGAPRQDAQEDQVPINPEASVPGPAEPAGPSHAKNGQSEEQAVPVNPPGFIPNNPPAVSTEQNNQESGGLAVRGDIFEPGHSNAPALDMPIVETGEDTAPGEQPEVSNPVEQLEVAEVMLDAPLECELALSGEASEQNSSSDFSDEDSLPLFPYFFPSPRLRSRLPFFYVPGIGAQIEEPVDRMPRQCERPPPRSRPMSIPVRARPSPLEEWASDDDSPPSDVAPSGSKRRRQSDRHQ